MNHLLPFGGWIPTGYLYAGEQIYTNAICEQIVTLLLHYYLLRQVQDALINVVLIKAGSVSFMCS